MISNRIFQAIPDHHEDNGGTVLILDPDKEPFVELPLRLDLRDHSPTGFAWGYGGSGPAQLALAILAEATDDELALLYYHDFREGVIQRQPAGTWSLHEEFVRGWLGGRARCFERQDHIVIGDGHDSA